MPSIPNRAHNFIFGLSDFWTKLFAEAPVLASAYDGMQLLTGQVYLDMLSDVLSLSLDDVPLFSKRYFQYLPIREDQLKYQEGPSPIDDRYVFSPSETLTAVPTLMNRVIAPTAVLENTLDYEVIGGGLTFKENLFSVDGEGTSMHGFPIRTTQVEFPYDFSLFTISDWTLLDARVGDILRLRIQNGITVEAPIALVGAKLVLSGGSNALKSDLRPYAFTVDILRNPYDAQQRSVNIENIPSLIAHEADVGGVIDGSTQYVQAGAVDFMATDGVGNLVYLNKYVFINDPVYDENSGVFRIRGLIDSNHVDLDRPAPFYNPAATAWATGTAYAPRTVVSESGNVYYAVTAHTSGTFAADLASGKWKLYLLDTAVLDYHYDPSVQPPNPISELPHHFLVPGTFAINGRRLLARRIGDTVYPAGGALTVGVDFVLDETRGQLVHLSAWDDTFGAFAEYQWRYLVDHQDVPRPAQWSPAHFYYKDDTVIIGGNFYRSLEDHLAGAVFSVDQPRFWGTYLPPVTVDVVYPSREIAFWAPDVLVDEQRLYENFGYLLAGGRKPSSEMYRQFLRGVMQLFVVGPSLQRLESAINSMAGLPVVRDDGEILTAYDDGLVASGTDGVFTDGQILRGGQLRTSGSFTSTDGNFFASDVLTTITVSRASNPQNDNTYIVTAVTGPGDVTVTPNPVSDEIDTGFIWHYNHFVFSRQFTTASYAFTSADVGGLIVVETASNAKNVGSFQILAVINSHTVLLDAPGGLTDEWDVRWQLTRRNTRIVTTTARTYTFPFAVPMRRDLSLPSSLNTLTFKAFEPLSTAFRVVDYIVDPTWFHNLTIPTELLTLGGDEAGRRRAAASLIPHVVGALDGAASGDPGLSVGVDDEGRPPVPRRVSAMWNGGNVLSLNQPIAVPADVGQYVAIGQDTPPLWRASTVYVLDDIVRYAGQEYLCTTAHTSASTFNGANWATSAGDKSRGSYKILAVSADGLRLTLERFPPPALVGLSVPQNFSRKDVALPPFIFRRTVGFVVMDRFLKYHSMRVKVGMRDALSDEMVRNLMAVLSSAKPAYTYIYVDPGTTFTERVTVQDSMSVGVGAHLVDPMPVISSDLLSGTVAHVADCYSYLSGTASSNFSVSPTTFTITPSIPGWLTAPYRIVFLFARFTAGKNADGTLICREGIDYSVNYSTGAVTVNDPNLTDTAYTLKWVACTLRSIASPDTANGETAIVCGGADPTVRRIGITDPSQQAGILDRALTIKIGP